jgi:hypothetical protein
MPPCYPSMNPFELIPLDEQGSPLPKLWALVLLLAIRDGATRVWYDPALGDSQLGYETGGVEIALVPPPQHLQAPLVDEMRRLLHRRGVRGFVARLLGAAVGRSAAGENSFVAKAGEREVTVTATLDLLRSRVVLRLSPDTGAAEAARAALESYVTCDTPALPGFEEPGEGDQGAAADQPRG